MSRVLFTTLGSLGDLHPLIAIGLELRRRGHTVRFCTSETYRAKIEGLGFGFDSMRPDATPENEAVAELIKEIMDPKRGVERLLCGLVLPRLRETYEDLKRAVLGPPRADLIISGELVYAAPVLAEQYNIRRATYITAPMSLFSVYDPPIISAFPRLSEVFRRFGPGFNGGLLRLIKWVTRNWSEPVRQLRTELGLPAGADPIYEGKYSPCLVLGGFSAVIASPQPDWPPNTVITGFPFYDGEKQPAPPELVKFLKAGEPPIVFTLGSSAVHSPGSFYKESIRAAQRLNRRALLLMGRNTPPAQLPNEIFCAGYVPFSEVFPHAAAIVHQGGIGTTGQALRAGRPMLVMPFNFDQQDNASRMARLGVGRTITRQAYNAKRVSNELQSLLTNPEYARKAQELGRTIMQEKGPEMAAESIERILG